MLTSCGSTGLRQEVKMKSVQLTSKYKDDGGIKTRMCDLRLMFVLMLDRSFRESEQQITQNKTKTDE